MTAPSLFSNIRTILRTAVERWVRQRRRPTELPEDADSAWARR